MCNIMPGFTKAFDLANHRPVLSKLKVCGLATFVLNWAGSSLSQFSSQQCVKVHPMPRGRGLEIHSPKFPEGLLCIASHGCHVLARAFPFTQHTSTHIKNSHPNDSSHIPPPPHLVVYSCLYCFVDQ